MTSHTKPHMLLWVDTETTGISRTNAKLLEIGMIVTSMDGIEEHDRFTVLALSLNAAIRKCMRRVARMCADCSAREQLDHQEGARA